MSYEFDSIIGREVRDVREHRLLLANTIKNSRYFIVQTAKVDREDHTAGQQEVGFRYFEGAAGGHGHDRILTGRLHVRPDSLIGPMP